MANIKHLQMAEAVCAFSGIEVRSSFLGLLTKVIYLPTGSSVSARTLEFSAETGQKLERVLLSDRERLLSGVGSYRAEVVENGNYMLEICQSADSQFVALQLFHYEMLGYQPATPVLFFEGDEAKQVSGLF